MAAQYPEKLAALQAGFQAAAQANQVLPLDARTAARLRPGLSPSLTAGRTRFDYYPGAMRYEMGMMPDMNGDWRLTATLAANPNASGMIAVRGNLHNGWGLSQKNGVPQFVYRVSDNPADIVSITAPAPLSAGSHQLSVAITHDNPWPISSGTITLSVDGRAVGSAQVPRFGFAYGLFLVGRQGYELLTQDEALPPYYEGKIDQVMIDIGPLPGSAR